MKKKKEEEIKIITGDKDKQFVKYIVFATVFGIIVEIGFVVSHI